MTLFSIIEGKNLNMYCMIISFSTFVSRSEILEQQKRLSEMTQIVNKMEQEKQNLMMTLEMMKHRNFLLEKSNEDLSLAAMSTMSPLQDKHDSGRMSHSTSSLVIVSLIILVLGLVTGVGLTTWYNHACNEVMLHQSIVCCLKYSYLSSSFIHLMFKI